MEKTQKNNIPKTGAVSMQDLGIQLVKKPSSRVGFSVWVHSLLQNWRQGTVATKGRSDVSRSTRKPWKQKGTGRARAGSARSPLWRGGGVIFGAQPRTKNLKITQGVKKNVLNALLFDFLEEGRVVCLDWQLENDKPKTSTAYNALQSADLAKQKINLFLPVDDVLGHASFANIPHVNIVSFDQANAFDLANSDFWVFLKRDFNQFKEMVSAWI